jgi:hypothetical protein
MIFRSEKQKAMFGWVLIVAWLTHIFVCFGNSMWGFLLAGAIFFPIGILHGFYLWVTMVL